MKSSTITQQGGSMDYSFWLMFLGVAIVLNATPGPDLLYIISNTLRGGKRIGFASSLGVCTGALFHVFIGAIGLSAIVLASALAFAVVKYLGVLYLFYLAYQSFKSAGVKFDITKKGMQKSAWSVYRQGVLIDILNPKVALFFMAFLPQFIREGHGSVAFQFIYLGVTVIVVAAIVEGTYVLLADKISLTLRKNRNFALWMDRVLGTVFAALGVSLLTNSEL